MTGENGKTNGQITHFNIVKDVLNVIFIFMIKKMKWKFRFNNPTRYNDINRCSYNGWTGNEAEKIAYNVWTKADDQRLLKIKRSFKRFLYEIVIFFREHIERY